ncbi:glycosyl hydrolase catalytic core-domain-containing protein [Dactylonectria estremocensis]|uniref:Glycosyl hydrolase catalytic core-domain-containing protein n=1 Tax=Dactylonectria estremocensis TaxID=1079267 RepID=A0A9P9EPS6_9HYPO|nr:glycosyl hydrolase catalytic core-domain-containing protein [Dactylonectria estremocensis]
MIISNFRKISVQSCCWSLLLTQVHGLDSSSKRGLAFHGDDHESDTQLLVSQNSTIAWYYTWSTYPSDAINDTVPFIPLIHGLDDASDSELVSRLDDLPASSTRLLTFNEPDGETDTGGSAISAKDAAKSYMSNIAPLRKSTSPRSRKWAISYPSVTGSDRGIEWLRDFNETCFDISDDGCPMDFVAVHWYGDYNGLVTWLDTLHDFYNETYPDVSFWITEMALPSEDEEATFAMMNSSLKYLDALDYVEGYAWFGAFRADEANEWTGDSVSFFDDDGDLTELGAYYLGGEERGFTEGTSDGIHGSPSHMLMLGLLVFAVFSML